MGADTKIEWCDHTFNPWVGCTKISPACDHCYAENWAKRTGHPELWTGERRRTSESNWQQPRKWNREAERAGVRKRVFCASMADVFDNQVPEDWRADLWTLIGKTPQLDWLLLTKRPQNIAKMLPITDSSKPGYRPWNVGWPEGWPNVWLGTTVEDQERANSRLWWLLDVPAAVHFVSYEPAIGPVDFTRAVHPSLEKSHEYDPYIAYDTLRGHMLGPDDIGLTKLDWVIAGGESGPGARPAHPDWFRSVRDQCAAANVPFLFKQWGEWAPRGGTTWDEWVMADGSRYSASFSTRQELESELPLDSCGIERVGKKAAGRLLDGVEYSEFPRQSR